MRRRVGSWEPIGGTIVLVATLWGQTFAEERLPGDAVLLAESISVSGGFLARCVAEEDPSIAALADGVRQVGQRFRVLELFEGSTHGDVRARVEYECLPDERPVRRDEVVLWFGRVVAGKGWLGTKALLDSQDNLFDASRAADHFRYEHRPSRLGAGVDYPKSVYALGEPMPIAVWLARDEPDSIVVWSDLAAGHFEIIASDGEPLKRTAEPEQLPEHLLPHLIRVADRPKTTVDLGGRYDWLEGREMRAFTLVWRGSIRVGEREAAPVELVTEPVRFAVRNPTRLSWGLSRQGLGCGLAAQRDTIAQGDRLAVHLGLRFDPRSAPPTLGLLNDFSREVGFTFTSTRTGESLPRGPLEFVGPGPRMPGRDHFVLLRERPIRLLAIDVPLLTPEGEQLPEGSYNVVAWYENEGAAEIVTEDAWCARPYVGPWTFWKGKITSAPIRIHVRHADPAQQEVQLNSGLDLKTIDGRTRCKLSTENPLHVRITRRPGFFLGRKDELSIAIGDDDFRGMGQGWSSATWDPNGACPCFLRPEDEKRIASGERLAIRADITVFETSNPPGHLWMPHNGAYRVLWQGRIEGGIPAPARAPAANRHH